MSIRQSATGEQIRHLLDFLNDHKDLARGSLRGPDARMRAKILWDEITTTLNSLGGAVKTAAQWQKVWADRKHLAKKNNAMRNRDHTGTGGGPAAGPSMTSVEERVMTIMGDNFGGPQTLARVPAFLGDENQPPDSPMVVEHLEEVEEEVVIADHDYVKISHCSSQPPQPLARTPLAPANTSVSQPSDQLVTTPLAPANNSTRRRSKNTRRRATMQSQPTVARNILDSEGQKVATLVEVKDALVGILNEMKKMNNTLVEIAQAVKEK